jgi:hypothetical protein
VKREWNIQKLHNEEYIDVTSRDNLLTYKEMRLELENLEKHDPWSEYRGHNVVNELPPHERVENVKSSKNNGD